MNQIEKKKQFLIFFIYWYTIFFVRTNDVVFFKLIIIRSKSKNAKNARNIENRKIQTKKFFQLEI